MIYGYARVSTVGQAKDGNSLDDQEAKLKSAGAEVIYKDAFTGTKIDRPELDKLMAVVGEGDTIVVSKLDRVARNAEAGLILVRELVEKGVTINILNMGILDRTPMGKAMTTMFFAFAEFERDMIVQRTQEGKAIARMRKDYHEGRPSYQSKEKRESILRAFSEGKITKEEAAAASKTSVKSIQNEMYKWRKENGISKPTVEEKRQARMERCADTTTDLDVYN